MHKSNTSCTQSHFLCDYVFTPCFHIPFSVWSIELTLLNKCFPSHIFHVPIYIFQSLIYTHDDVARKMYDDVFPDAFDLVAPPPPVFDAVSEQHRYVTIRKNGKQPLVSS